MDNINDVQYLCEERNVFLELNASDYGSEFEKELQNFHFETGFFEQFKNFSA